MPTVLLLSTIMSLFGDFNVHPTSWFIKSSNIFLDSSSAIHSHGYSSNCASSEMCIFSTPLSDISGSLALVSSLHQLFLNTELPIHWPYMFHCLITSLHHNPTDSSFLSLPTDSLIHHNNPTLTHTHDSLAHFLTMCMFGEALLFLNLANLFYSCTV